MRVVAAPDECLFLKIKTGGLLLNSDKRMLFKKGLSSHRDLRGNCTPEQRGRCGPGSAGGAGGDTE